MNERRPALLPLLRSENQLRLLATLLLAPERQQGHAPVATPLLPPAHWEGLFDAAYTMVLEPGQVPPSLHEAAAAVRDIVDIIDQAG